MIKIALAFFDHPDGEWILFYFDSFDLSYVSNNFERVTAEEIGQLLGGN